MKSSDHEKNENIFLRKILKRNLSIPLHTYYLDILISQNILKDLSEMFKIFKEIKNIFTFSAEI